MERPAHKEVIQNTKVSETSSSRRSMNLIEGASQQFNPNHRNLEPTAIASPHTQRKRWDAFFDPQYSFGSFVHGTNQTMDTEDYEHLKKLDRIIDDGNHLLEHNKSPRSTSTRPSCDGASSHCTGNSTPTAGIVTPTLPCVGENRPELDTQVWGPPDEKTLIDRLELLKKIRAPKDVHTEEQEEGPEEDKKDHSTTTTKRWKRNITKKARQLRKEAQADTESVASSGSSSLDPDEDPSEKKNIDEEEKAQPKNQMCCRRSFLCFMLGFLFPPLWLFGAFYFSSYANRQSSASRRIDHLWRRRSRIAFGIFIICLMIILVIVFVLKPEAIGWRRSKQEQQEKLMAAAMPLF